MAIKNIVYSRSFIPKEEKIFFGIFSEHLDNQEEVRLRKKLYEKFANKGGFGFDGKVFYSFKIKGHVYDKEPYKIKIKIEKSGNGKVIENEFCDLEDFLIKNDFDWDNYEEREWWEEH